MGDKSGIEWTDATWNPVTGCTKVSQGCKNCYAKHQAWPRLKASKGTVYFGREFEDVSTHDSRLDQPLKWSRPRRVFVNSMSDLFHEDVPFEFIVAVFGVMAAAMQHTFQVLTKRPQRMLEWSQWLQERGGLGPFIRSIRVDGDRTIPNLFASVARTEVVREKTVRSLSDPWMSVFNAAACVGSAPLPNVWLGVSVEDQETTNERVPILLDTPAAVRWISAEPLLGPIDLTSVEWPDKGGHRVDTLRAGYWNRGGIMAFGQSAELGEARGGFTNHSDMARLNWVVVGGESGPGARPMHPEWARGIRDQCEASGVPFLFKQWGAWATNEDSTLRINVGKKLAGRKLDGRTWDQYP